MKKGESQLALGFVTVVDHPQHGLFGGLLLLNAAGRPLEFHCTAPVKPNRAQQILYGPTLVPYLYGEQIGQALVRKASIDMGLLCADLAPMLAVRQHIAKPVVLVLPPNDDTAHAMFSWAQNRLSVAPGNDADQQAVTEFFALLPDTLDLWEPFGRIREAITEAQPASSRAAA